MLNINLTKEKDSIVLIDKDKNIIEVYSKTETVDFSKLMGYLLNLELTHKINLIINPDAKYDDGENTILGLVTKIINEYNNKVDEFLKFVNENNENKK